MYGYGGGRGRAGPSKSTPANVQCQKCLKKDMCRLRLTTHTRNAELTVLASHYSYECTSAPQERPYKARPSRTQQLLNPKLKPKLTGDIPNPLQKKQGVADEEIAKREAVRAKQRGLEADDEGEAAIEDAEEKRRRSLSPESVSSISTRSSASPPPRKRSRSPNRPVERSRRESSSRSRSSSSGSRLGRRRSLDSVSENDRPVSRQSVRDEREDSSRSRRSPPPHSRDSRRRDQSFERDRRPAHARSRLESSDFFDDDGGSSSRPRHDSRSPGRAERGNGGRREFEDSYRYRDREDGPRDRQERRQIPQKREVARERSLSPFSKRLALTQAINKGR